eukprot:gene20836-27668_t
MRRRGEYLKGIALLLLSLLLLVQHFGECKEDSPDLGGQARAGRQLATSWKCFVVLRFSQKAEDSQRIHVFPGVDGGLYAYHGLEDGKAKLERLPVTLPELVDASPSLTDDGSVILGKRVTTLFLVDRRTGDLLKVLSDVSFWMDDYTKGEEVLESLLNLDDAVILGREDFVVRSLQLGSGQETWNASYSRMTRLIPNSRECSPLADNQLMAYDRETGYRLWSIAFDAPPVAAYSDSNTEVGTTLEPPKPLPCKAAGHRL